METRLLNNSKQENKLKIFHVAPHYPPYLGGMEKRIKDLAVKQSLTDEVTVLTSDQSYKAKAAQNTDYDTKKGLEVIRMKSIEILGTPIFPALIFKLLKIPKNSIVHIHSALAYSPEASSLICRMRKIPYIVHIRLESQPSSFAGRFLLPLYKKFVLSYVLRKASSIIVLTDDAIDMISDKYKIDKRKIISIPNATDFPVLNPKKHISKIPKLLLVGRLSKQKNIPLAIKAVKLLFNKGITVNLNIVGTGPLKNDLISLSKNLKVEHLIKFTGRLEGKALHEAYAKSDIVVQTSFEEGFSSVLLEAMASARPIIATDIPGTRSIINNKNGILIDPYDAQQLSNAIEKLIIDKKIRQDLVNAGKKELKKYKWQDILTKTKNLYCELINLE